MDFNDKIEVLHQLYTEGELSAERFIEIVRRWSEESRSVVNEPFIWPPIYYGRWPDEETGTNPVPPFSTECDQSGWTLTYDDGTSSSENATLTYEVNIDPEQIRKIWKELIEERTCTSS